MHEFDSSDPNDLPEENINWQPENGEGKAELAGLPPDGYIPVDEAFLPTDEYVDIPDTAGETSPRAVAERCAVEIKSGVAELYDQIDIDGVESTSSQAVHEAAKLGEVIAALAKEAAAADDAEEVGRHVDMLLGMEAADLGQHVAVCFAGATVGNTRAFDTLHTELQTEKDELTDVMERRNARYPYTSRPAFNSSVLTMVVGEADDRGMSRDDWIDRYAVDESHKWELGVRFLAYAAEESGEDQAARQEVLDDKLAELVGVPRDEIFVFTHTPTALELAKDPGLRESIVSRARFAITSNKVPLTEDSFGDLLQIATAVVSDPELATPTSVGVWGDLVNRRAEALQRAGMVEPYELTRQQMDWRVAVKRFEGATPEELIETVNLQASQMIAGAPEVSDEGLPQEYYEGEAIKIRDNILIEQSIFAARQGDFVAARKFMTNISESDRQQHLISSMLVDAYTPEQVEAIRPNQMTLDFDPALQQEFEHAELLVSGDIDAITERATRYISTYEPDAETDDPVRFAFIHTAYRVLSQQDQHQNVEGRPEEPRVLMFARTVLAAMRDAHTPITDSLFLSDALITADDPEEPQRAYDAITNANLPPARRINMLWQLARTINKET